MRKAAENTESMSVKGEMSMTAGMVSMNVKDETNMSEGVIIKKKVIIRFALDVTTFAKPHPSNLGQKYPTIADLKPLRIAEALSAFATLFEYRELFRIGLIESLAESPAKVLQCLLECLRWGIGQKWVLFLP